MSETTNLDSFGSPEIGLNHLGRIGKAVVSGLFQRAKYEEQETMQTAPQVLNDHLIELMTQIEGDELSLIWLYRGDLWKEQKIKELSQDLLEYLRSLVTVPEPLRTGQASNPKPQSAA